ncbi:hypothetical protein ACFCYH_13170 [Streptomyces sp. NPDC056400]|uniref:hypothetical protein n=1 Tax=Streptomyces sp. NPDC056400 TaxID=3345808 RepID=UPI0035D6EBC3
MTDGAAHTYDYELISHLLADPATRDAGARLARAACHEWRAAPVELLPLLIRRCRQQPGAAVLKALATAAISDEAMRVHGAAAATVAFTPYPKPRLRRRVRRRAPVGQAPGHLPHLARPRGLRHPAGR